MGAHDQRRSGNCAQAKHARDRSENCTDTATEAHKDPVRADRHLCYAQRSRGGRAARPSATTPVRQPHAGRLAVAAPARSGRCRGASCAVHVALLCSRSQPSRSGHDHRRRAPARILKQGTGTIRRPCRQGGCLQGVHTRVWGHRESALAVAPGDQLTCSLTAAQAAALRPNSVASRSPLQLQRPSPVTIPESIQK